MPSPQKVLIVDDDPHILSSFLRLFSKTLEVHTASKVEQAVNALEEGGPFAVVVSDYRMPVMNGIKFLKRVQDISPDTVRMMLTGYADLQTALAAVNEGNVFRLLTKPCPPKVMGQALVDGIRQYQLVHAERELLDKTVAGSVKMLGELLSMAKPDAFGRGQRVAELVREMAEFLEAPDQWEINTAAQLSQLGMIVFPDGMIRRIAKGKQLNTQEAILFRDHAANTAQLVSGIPRMKPVAEIIAYQNKSYDGGGYPEDSVRGRAIPLGARLLKAALDFDALVAAGRSKPEALHKLKQMDHTYDPEAVEALAQALGDEAQFAYKEVGVAGLEEGMTLADDLYTVKPRRKLVARGQKITRSVLSYVERFRDTQGIEEPLRVVYQVEY